MNSPPDSSSQGQDAAPRSFKSLYCKKFNCPPEEFEERAFKQCLYWHARILAPIIQIILPNYFADDRAMIHYLGDTPGWREAKNELAAFVEAVNTKGGIFHDNLWVRVSAKKAGAVASQVFELRSKASSAKTTAPSGDATLIV